MIADRAPAVASLQETGEEVLKAADEDTKAPTEEGLRKVTSQWQELNDLVNTRKSALDVAMEASIKFGGLLADANQKIAAAQEELQGQQLGQKAAPEEIQVEANKLQVWKYSPLYFQRKATFPDLRQFKDVKLGFLILVLAHFSLKHITEGEECNRVI